MMHVNIHNSACYSSVISSRKILHVNIHNFACYSSVISSRKILHVNIHKFCISVPEKFCNLQGPKKTSPSIDGFYRNCSCISMYISCISSKTSSHKSAPGLLFWNTTRTQKTCPTINVSVENVMESAHC